MGEDRTRVVKLKITYYTDRASKKGVINSLLDCDWIADVEEVKLNGNR